MATREFYKTSIIILSTLGAAALIAEPQASTSGAPSISVAQETEVTVPTTTMDTLVIVDETAQQVVKLLEKLTGRTAIVQQDLPTTKLNINLKGPLSLQQSVVALESLLSINGISVTEFGEKFLKVVPTAKGKYQAPEMLEGSTLNLPTSQKIFSKLFQLKYLSVIEAVPLATPLVNPGTSIVVPFEKANALLVTDCLSNLQQIERVLERVDRLPQSKDSIRFFTLKNVSAAELQRQLQQLQETTFKRYFKNNTTFKADERTNQLMVMTPEENIPLVENLIQNFDIDVPPLTRTEVIFLKHAEALKVCELVKKIIVGQQDKAKEKDKANAPDATSMLARLRAMYQNQTGGDANGVQFSKSATVESDERANAIVAYGNPTDIKQIKDLVDKLDGTLAQVRIDVVIAEVTLTKGTVSGLDSLSLSTLHYMNHKDMLVGASSSNDDTVGQPIKINSMTLRDFSLNSVFGVAKKNSDVRILSAPSITTTHHKKAVVEVGQETPVTTGILTTQTPTASDSASKTTNETVTWKPITLKLEITPLIGADGVVQLEIDQTFDRSIGSVTVNDRAQPIIGKRHASSFISVNNNETLVLSGLQETRTSKEKRHMFLLGELPGIGELFTRKVDTNVTTELIIFIRPTILYLPGDAKDVDAQRVETLQLKPDVDGYMQNGKFATALSVEDVEGKKSAKKTKSSTQKPVNEPKSEVK